MINLKTFAQFFGVLALFSVNVGPQEAEAKDPFARWEPAIKRFEVADEETPPPKNAILFVGSSSVRRWDLDKYFPELKVINRGFGGSQIADSTHFAERIVMKHSPRIVVLYAGDNDIAGGKSAETVVGDFRDFVEKVHGGLPETKIVFIAIKPCVARWKHAEANQTANRAIESICGESDLLEFVDVWDPMLAGQPGPPAVDLFASDGLHLSDKGYELWKSLVLPHLK